MTAWLLALVLAAALLPAISAPASAAGFQTYLEQGTAAMAQATAVAARAEDPSAVFFNPAAIGWLPGSQVQVNLCGLIPSSTYQPGGDDAFSLCACDAQLEDLLVLIPSLHVTHRLNERWTIGLGVNTPYGSSTEWEPEWCGRYYAAQTRLASLLAAPTVAWRVSETFGLGMGVGLAWGKAHMERAINAPVVFAGAVPELSNAFIGGSYYPDHDIQTTVEGSDWSWGGRFGAYWQPNERWAFGFTYQSQISLEPEGEAEYTVPTYEDADFGGVAGTGATANQLAATLFPDTDAGTFLDLPATLTGGVSFAPAEDWTLEVDLTWTDWSAYDSLVLVFDELAGGTQVRRGTPKEWEDVIALKFSASYRATPEMTARVGYAYDESPIPDTTRDPSLPGSNRHDLGLGFTYTQGSWSWELAYMYVLFGDAPSELESATDGMLNGEYDTEAHLIGLAVAKRF